MLEAARELRPLPPPPAAPVIATSLAAYEVAVDELSGGGPLPIARGTFTLDSGSPVTPVGTVELTIPSFGNVWEAEAGGVIRLEITNLDSPFITPSRVPSVTEISNVRLEVPAR